MDKDPTKEKLSETQVAAVVCQDEDAWFEGVMFGIVASGVTKKGEGNQNLFPDRMRNILETNRSKIIGGLKSLASNLGIKELGTTSHPGCGGGNAQNIKGENIATLTKEQLDELHFFGHLPVSDRPQVLDPEKNVSGFMDRQENDHLHQATFVDVTVGGGITFSEKKKKYENRGNKKAFQVSADWVSGALDLGMSEEDAIDVLVLQLKIAYSIAEGVGKNNKRFQIFDAKRTSDRQVLNKNSQIASKAIEKANDAISQGIWTTPPKH